MKAKMRIMLREDLDPDIDFYYHQQFKIYHEPYLIWDRQTWDQEKAESQAQAWQTIETLERR